MKKTILTFAITSTMVGTSVFWHFNQKLKTANETVSYLNEQIENRDAEIGKLEDNVKLKEKFIEEQNLAIGSYIEQIGKMEETIKNLEEQKQLEEQQQQQEVNKKMTVDASAYIAMCTEGCSGITRSGYDVRNTIYYNGMRIIATDLNVIPMYSIVKIEGFSEKFIVLDTGGGIKGNKIDILFPTTRDAINFGRRKLELEVVGSER